MVKADKVENKDQKVEKSSKKSVKLLFKEEESKEKYFKWNCLRAIYF